MNTYETKICVLPWSHVYLGIGGDIQLCCVAKPPLKQRTIDNTPLDRWLHSPYMDHVRLQMRRGMWPAECAACMEKEAHGLGSYRQWVNGRNISLLTVLQEDARSVQPRLVNFDLRLGNTCNFRCRSCSAHYSSAWRDDHLAIYGTSHGQPKKLIAEDALSVKLSAIERVFSQLEEINFAGGEPLLLQQHYLILEKLIAAQRTSVTLAYTTNLSVLRFRRWEILELWKKFSHLYVNLSIDGSGAQGEYIRDGLNWCQWLENVSRLQLQVPHAIINVHFVVSLFNILDLPAHVDALIDAGILQLGKRAGYNIGFTLLDVPAYLSVTVLPLRLKQVAEQRIGEYCLKLEADAPETARALHGLVALMMAKNDYHQYANQFVAITRVLDERRKQSAELLFPELMQGMTENWLQGLTKRT